jgi:Uma2 family endonuclease
MATGVAPPPGTSPDDEPEGLYEVVDGRVVEKPPMGALEAWVASRLASWLIRFQPIDQLGQVVVEMLFLIDPARDLKRRPDVAFVSHERWPVNRRVPRINAWEVVPDLAIEVISTTNTADEVMDKLEEYFQAGARLVWVIYPKWSTIYVYESPTAVRVLRAGDELDGGTVLPGLRLPLAALFGGEPFDDDPDSAA